MAGDWIKMRTNLWDDPRISKLCDITDQPEAAIVGGLYWLWATADEHTESGILPGLTTRAIDRKTGVTGLGQGLVDIGWLADHPEGVRIVGFEEHNGSSAKKRCQTAKRVEKHKTGNAPVTQQALADNADSVSDALPREEKRREEVNQEQEHGKADASDSTTHLVEFDGVDFKVSAHLITKWEQAFPAVNVELEIERAAVWAISNPNRAKKDWRKFLSNWLAKASPVSAPEGNCPVDKIIDLYHQACPNLPPVSVASDKALRSMIVERWNESPAHQSGQHFWQPFFQKANRRNQVFYRGQNVQPRLESLVSRAVFREISEAAA